MTRLAVGAIAVLAMAATGFPGFAASDSPGVAGLPKVTQDQFEYCGMRVVFLNPDLRPQSDGLVHASGWFFIQFQVIAESPDFTVDRLAFSFGKPIPENMRTCDAPEWITGAYYRDYRVDDDPSDGFFIPINTTNVPDGEYAAALHVYSGGEEVGRMFTTAIVENGCQMAQCSDRSPEEILRNDRVQPWPIVLPGDGQQIHSGAGLTVEFGELVTNVSATVNGSPVNLTEMEPRLWDDDVIAAALDEDAPACPACRDRAWGPAYRWDGQIPEGAIVQVDATDLNGNNATKILHLTSTTVGGVISIQQPRVEVRVPAGEKHVPPGETANFNVLLQNVGRDTAHTNLAVDGGGNITAEWRPNHVVVGSGEEVNATLVAMARQEGTYRIEAFAEYKADAEDVRVDIPLTLVVGRGNASGGGPETQQEGNDTNETDLPTVEEVEDTPVSPLVLGGAAATAALLARRRRR